ncbi:MAG: chloride channel protein [Bacteroidetes bacterium]|nr:chloride channel protein [Bacteroidota bacterium]
MDRKIIKRKHYFRLIVISFVIGLITAVLGYSLKIITELAEERIFRWAMERSRYLFVLLPSIGITGIYFLRKYLFLNRKNKGIAEIYKTVDQRKDHLPFFKIPSHYINGFLTVIFGGSTGIEVSTVVATATVGNVFYEKNYTANIYKLELICAGVTAGISILFGSPIVGWLFAMEAIARKINKTLVIACTSAAVSSWIILYFFPTKPIINTPIGDWTWIALPFMIILSLFSGLLSAYFTLLVVHIKDFFNNISNNFVRVNSGAVLVGIFIMCFPFLYGDSYHSLNSIFNNPYQYSIIILLGLAIIKPLVSSLTLGAGGDGGVFAPSIVAGAYLGIAFSLICNSIFSIHLKPLNFALIGAAAMLSTSIYAPLTTIFLICNLVPNGFNLVIPILIVSFSSKIFTKKMILPYNVYTFFTNKT